MNQQSINSRLIEAERQANIKNEFKLHKEKGDTHCLVFHMGTNKQYFFYPVSNSMRYIKSLEKTDMPKKVFRL